MNDLEINDAKSEPILMEDEELDQVTGGVNEAHWVYYYQPEVRDNPDGTVTKGYMITGEEEISGTIARSRFVAERDFERWKTDAKRKGATLYDGSIISA